MSNIERKFLFLQGPHGLFFRELAKRLSNQGAEIHRFVFNAGDWAFWIFMPHIKFQKDFNEWSDSCLSYMKANKITDLVLYGDARPIHKVAIQHAKTLGIKLHIFEEGYLRPYWITYEQEGANGNSPLIDISVKKIKEKMKNKAISEAPSISKWGDSFEHNWYGLLYHFFLALGAPFFRNYKTHRDISIAKEVVLNAIRLISLPYVAIKRRIDTFQFLRRNQPYFVVMLQLEHDASLQAYSAYKTQITFAKEVLEAFKSTTDSDVRLLFKLHPFDDGRAQLRQKIRKIVKTLNLEKRVAVISGGKLGAILDSAQGALTINSTSAQQVAWRGLPLYIAGKSVFQKPEFSQSGSIIDFFSTSVEIDRNAFLAYRTYLLSENQLRGGFYRKKSRKMLLERCYKRMLH